MKGVQGAEYVMHHCLVLWLDILIDCADRLSAGEKGDPAARLILDRYKGDRGLPGAPGEPGLAGLEGSPGERLTASQSVRLS